MQLAKQNWKRSRNSERYTIAVPDKGFRCKRGGYKTHDEQHQEYQSRLNNPQDPINLN